MKMTGKTAGIGLVALSAVMLAGAGIADTMRGDQGMGMMMGPMLDIATLDTDKDGKISEAEIEAHRAAQLAAVDADKNGLLSAEELAAMHVKAMTERANAMAQRMIERLDGDGDGLLSAAELASRPMPANLFDRIDANEDGFIDQAEIDAARQMMADRMGGRGHHGGGKHGGWMGGHDGDGQGWMGGND